MHKSMETLFWVDFTFWARRSLVMKALLELY